MAENGRIVIPAAVRRRAGWKPGEPLTVRAEGERVIIESRDALIDRLQSELEHLREDGDKVDELIALRRREAAREREEIDRWKARRGS